MARLSSATLTLQIAIDPPVAALWVDGKYTATRILAGLAIDEDHRIAVSAGHIGKVVVFRSEQGGEKHL